MEEFLINARRDVIMACYSKLKWVTFLFLCFRLSSEFFVVFVLYGGILNMVLYCHKFCS